MAVYLGVRIDDVVECRQLGIRWADIGRILGLNTNRLRAWRRAITFVDPLSPVTDDQLLAIPTRNDFKVSVEVLRGQCRRLGMHPGMHPDRR